MHTLFKQQSEEIFTGHEFILSCHFKIFVFLLNFMTLLNDPRYKIHY